MTAFKIAALFCIFTAYIAGLLLPVWFFFDTLQWVKEQLE